MQEVTILPRDCATSRPCAGHAVQLCARLQPRPPQIDPKVAELHLMLLRFTASGGVATGDEIAGRMRGLYDRPVSQLARWIVDREAVNVTWGTVILLPIFQFEGTGMTRRPIVKDVLSELRSCMDDWACALWFATPNVWLDSALPVDLLVSNPSAVHEASRADRFAILG